MTIEQASAVNTLINYITGTPTFSNRPPERWDAIKAAKVLARAAHKKLASGITEASVAELMPEHTPQGYDPTWLVAINGVLEDREANVRVTDLDDWTWECFVGPLCDAFEGDHEYLTVPVASA